MEDEIFKDYKIFKKRRSGSLETNRADNEGL